MMGLFNVLSTRKKEKTAMTKSSNYKEPDFITIRCKVLDRVKLELGNKQYYSDEAYAIIIFENRLNPYERYNKDTDERNMLESVYAILQTLANDIDIFRKIETEFATEDQAYKYLQLRLQDVQNRINLLPNPETEEESNVGYLFFNRGNGDRHE